MHNLIYISSAVVPFTEEQLAALLLRARRRNREKAVTGMLLYKDGSFMQLLEGAEAEVEEIYGRVAVDPRHRGLIRLLSGACSRRSFPDWTMGFNTLGRKHFALIPGFKDFLNPSLTDEAFTRDPTLGKKLLLSFRKH
jgi:hypothetical protein